MNFDSRELIENRAGERVAGPEEYAGLLPRFVATVVDGFVLAIPMTIVVGVLIALMIFMLPASGSSDTAGSAAGMALSCVMCLVYPAIFIAMWLYYAGFESSRYMATPGKMLMGIVVTDLDGNQLSFGKATVRFILKQIFNMIFYIGSLYILVSDKKQGLYDVVAGTLVVKKS